MPQSKTHKPFSFVLMPFSKDFDDIYQIGIKETAIDQGFVCERVDEQIYQESMLERIYRQIDLADVIIADMTGKNPNVFYEVGYAHAKGKLVILLTSDSGDIPFDLKHHRHIVYQGSALTLRKQLSTDLKWALKEIQRLRESRISVTLQEPVGLLKATDWYADGEVEVKIDLANETQQPSPEIESIYLYTRKGWVIEQHGKACPVGQSDKHVYGERHFLESPLRRLQKGGWAQIQFKMKRTLALAVKGEAIKDKYNVSGKICLRIVTTSGDYDYELLMDVDIEDVPF
ncbi:hypothetical protein PQQ64_25625 [Paraburkholderia graminis]|uniref:hypothetical protein n=1 Tax=Paraburkholderia graminis TaxID=60548 RepID=UPI0038B941F4